MSDAGSGEVVKIDSDDPSFSDAPRAVGAAAGKKGPLRAPTDDESDGESAGVGAVAARGDKKTRFTAEAFAALTAKHAWVDSSSKAKVNFISSGNVTCVPCKGKSVAVAESRGNLSKHADGKKHRARCRERDAVKANAIVRALHAVPNASPADMRQLAEHQAATRRLTTAVAMGIVPKGALATLLGERALIQKVRRVQAGTLLCT